MGIYLGTFSFFVFLLWIREKISKQNPITRINLAIIALLGISIFSGIRNLYVGIDIGTYGNVIFESVSTMGIKSTMTLYERWADFGYVLFNYGVSIFSDNIHVLLGVQTFTIELSMILFFSTFKDDQVSLPLSMGIFNIIFLPFSFSMLRQSLALAIIIWVPIALMKKKWGWASVLTLIAFSFHKSSIVASFLFIIIHVFFRKNRKFNILKFNIITGGAAVVLSVLIQYFPYLINTVTKQLSVATFNQGETFSILRLFLFLLPIILMKRINMSSFISSDLDKYFYVFSVAVIIGNFLSGFNFGIARFILYLLPMYVFFLCLQVKKIDSKRVRLTVSFLLLIWAVFCLYAMFYRGNVGGVFPYVAYWENYNPSWLNDLGGWVDKSNFYRLFNY